MATLRAVQALIIGREFNKSSSNGGSRYVIVTKKLNILLYIR
jgi:hypothetical protein